MTRPTTQRVVTPKDRQRRRSETEGMSMSVRFRGVDYTIRQGDVCAADAAALRRDVGYSFVGLMSAGAKDPDIDIFAAIIWLARRAEGERSLTFDEVAQDVTYDDFDEDPEGGEQVEADEGAGSPEQ